MVLKYQKATSDKQPGAGVYCHYAVWLFPVDTKPKLAALARAVLV
jgi:hypothetical protein